MANEVVGIDIVARLDGFRSELAKIPDIGGKEAKALVSQLSREIKQAERASKSAASAARDHGAATKGMGAAVLKASISMELLKKGLNAVASGISATVKRAMELDEAAGGGLTASLDAAKVASQALFDSGVRPLIPAIGDLISLARDASAAFSETGNLARWASTLADVTGGAVLATRAIFGLTAAQDEASGVAAHHRAAVEKQAEAIVDLKRELALSKALDEGLTLGKVTQSAKTRELTAAIEAQIATMHRLQGVAGLATNDAPASGAPKAKGAKGKAASSPASGASAAPVIEAVAAAADTGREALSELRDQISAVADTSATAAEAVQADADRQVAKIRESLAVVVGSREIALQEVLSAVRESRAAEVAVEMQAAAEISAIKNSEHKEAMERIERERSARVDALNNWLGVAYDVTGAIAGLVEAGSDAAINATNKESKERRKAMKKAWEAQTALAIAQAAINIPLSIGQAAAGPWPAAIGFMIAAGLASTLAFAGVVAKAAAGPSFHTGGTVGSGKAPDEVSITALQGEGVASRAAMDRIGGPEGLRRLNRGESPSEDRPIMVIQQVRHRVLDAAMHDGMRTGSGTLIDLARSVRPRVGLHHPFRSM